MRSRRRARWRCSACSSYHQFWVMSIRFSWESHNLIQCRPPRARTPPSGRVPPSRPLAHPIARFEAGHRIGASAIRQRFPTAGMCTFRSRWVGVARNTERTESERAAGNRRCGACDVRGDSPMPAAPGGMMAPDRSRRAQERPMPAPASGTCASPSSSSFAMLPELRRNTGGRAMVREGARVAGRVGR